MHSYSVAFRSASASDENVHNLTSYCEVQNLHITVIKSMAAVSHELGHAPNSIFPLLNQENMILVKHMMSRAV